LEIDKADSHIPTATAAADNIFFPKGQKPACPEATRLQAHLSTGKDCRRTEACNLTPAPHKLSSLADARGKPQ
jgi:hypothetical protein